MAEFLRDGEVVWLDAAPFYQPKHKHPATLFGATAIAMPVMERLDSAVGEEVL